MTTNSTHIDRVLGSMMGKQSLLSAPLPRVGDHIVTSWRRCLTDYGLKPDRVPQALVLSAGELRPIRESLEDLLVVADAELRRLLIHLQESDYILTMTNAQGVVVLARYAASLRGAVELARTVAGSVWSEEYQGTNGVGTCLKEGAPLSVVMDDHFGVQLVSLSCTVAPIFDGGSNLLGVINVTTPRRSSHHLQAMVRRTVTLSARRIENLHLQRQHAGCRILRLSHDNDFADLAHEARAAVDASGCTLAATPGVAELLGISARSLVGRNVTEYLELREPDDSAGRGPVRLRGANGRLVFVHMTMPHIVRESGPAASPARSKPHAPRVEEASSIALRLLERGLPVLLQGETGSGKSELARALHDAGRRAKRPFVAVNCAAIPGELIEGELFGHMAGAYTGALRNGAKGLIRAADGGTLFLDEIGDMPLALQSRLLDVLSDGEVLPLGAVRGVRVDIAVVAASLHDIAELVRRKQFREDLYFRLNGVTLTLPPLRERADRQDIVARILNEEAARAGCAVAPVLADAATAAMLAYPWPGNLRELRHALRYALAMAEGPEIAVRHLPDHVRSAGADHARPNEAMLQRALTETNWNVSAAARLLGISRATLHRKVQTARLRPRQPACYRAT